MPIIRLRRTLVFGLALIFFHVAGSVGFADTSDLDALRLQLEEVQRSLTSTRDQIDVLQELLDEDRVYSAPVQVGDLPLVQLFTWENAVRAWTFERLTTLQDSGELYDPVDFTRILQEVRRSGQVLRTRLEQEIASLRERERAIERERNNLEQAVAELQGPQPTGRCVDLQRVDRARPLGEAAYVNRGAIDHFVTQSGDTGRGWAGNFTLTWSAPPDRLCVGQTFEVTLTAANNAPFNDVGLARAAQLGMTFRPGAMTAVCGNPPGFDPASAAFVSPSDSTYTNTCTITVLSVSEGRQPMGEIFVSLSAIPQIGNLAYIYQ